MRFRCSRCGEGWPDHPVTRVPCPTCHVKAGTWCKRLSGHRAADLHIDRERAALAADVLRICRPEPTGTAQLSLDLIGQERSEKVVFVELRDVEPFDP